MFGRDPNIKDSAVTTSEIQIFRYSQLAASSSSATTYVKVIAFLNRRPFECLGTVAMMKRVCFKLRGPKSWHILAPILMILNHANVLKPKPNPLLHPPPRPRGGG